MITIARGHDLWRFPSSADKMFEDRRIQFKERNKWNVHIDSDGYEVDQYDRLNPVYIIINSSENPHCGSMRILPLGRETMLMDYFSETVKGYSFKDKKIWECTRFCVSKGQGRSVALKLFASGSAFLSYTGFSDFIAIFDKKMLRFYKTIGISPKIIGVYSYLGEEVYSGLFNCNQERYKKFLISGNIESSTITGAISRFHERETYSYPKAA